MASITSPVYDVKTYNVDFSKRLQIETSLAHRLQGYYNAADKGALIPMLARTWEVQESTAFDYAHIFLRPKSFAFLQPKMAEPLPSASHREKMRTQRVNYFAERVEGFFGGLRIPKSDVAVGYAKELCPQFNYELATDWRTMLKNALTFHWGHQEPISIQLHK